MKLYIWALLVTIFSIFLSLLVRDLGKVKLKHKILAVLIGTVICPLVNLYVKRPVFESLTSLLKLPKDQSIYPMYFVVLAPFIVGIIEEGIKIFPFIIRGFKRFLEDKESAFTIGVLIGIGFGIGEAWYLAYELSPISYKYPFIYLSGFGGERAIATGIHLSLTGIFAYGISIRKGFLFYLFVLSLHAIVDLFASLYQSGVLSPSLTGLFTYILGFSIFCLAIWMTQNMRKTHPHEFKEDVLYEKGKKRFE